MATRPEQISAILEDVWGRSLGAAAPELPYQVNRILVRFGRTDDTLPQLWDQLDSLLFNTVYLATNREMIVETPVGLARVTTDGIRELADRLLSLVYRDRQPTPLLKDALFDLARAGSFAAMRELIRRYPLEEDERQFILRVLGENGELS